MKIFVMLGFSIAALMATLAGLIFAANAMAYLAHEEAKGSGKVLCISGLAVLLFVGLAVWFSRGFSPGI